MNYNFTEMKPNGKMIGQTTKSFKLTQFLIKKNLLLDMFPYPSGAGFACGHPIRPILLSDILRATKGTRVLMCYTQWL